MNVNNEFGHEETREIINQLESISGQVSEHEISGRIKNFIKKFEVKSGTWIAHDIGQLGEYMQEIKANEAIPDEKIFSLYVVGEGDLTPLADQIRGSAWRDRIRFISCDDLLSLVNPPSTEVEGIHP